jgi:hypothetical protein
MHTIGVLLLAATTTGDGFGYNKPFVGFKKLLRHHVVVDGPAPPGGPMAPMGGGGMGCAFGHPGCAGGPTCPGGGGAGGPGGPGGAGGRRFPNVRSQIYFLDPDGMKVGWQTGGSQGERIYLPAQLTVPARYNFMQGYIYRLKLTDIPGRPGVQLYPTIEVAPSTPATDAYLTHNPIPVQFTAEDFDQVIDGGNFVTKVLYLPDPKFQELAIPGVETLVSTRLEPGVDPILEADKRGTILLIVRLGGIDLEMQSPGVSYPAGVGGVAPPPGTVILPPGSLPPGNVMTQPIESVPVDTAPVSPVQPGATPPPPPQPSMPEPGNAPASPPQPGAPAAPAAPPEAPAPNP